jgi:hypothetical protein
MARLVLISFVHTIVNYVMFRLFYLHFHTVFRDTDGTQRPMRSSWFSIGFQDAATFHMILANSAAHLDHLRGVKAGKKGVDAEKYHLLALQSINQRMSEPTLEVTDELIGAVSGFVCHNVCSLLTNLSLMY